MIGCLLIIIIGLLVVQILQHAPPRSTVMPGLSTSDQSQRPSEPDRLAVCDTTVLRLLAPNGEEEFEVSWHRGELPPTYRHADLWYVRGLTRADGSVEFRR